MFGKFSSYPAFIMPNYCKHPRQIQYLKEAIDGIVEQTDSRWQLFIIDDDSPCKEQVINLLSMFPQEIFQKIIFIPMEQNRGQGFCRNIGSKKAAENNVDFILYNDADDISHPERLKKTRAIFESRPQMDLIYSTFRVINENSQMVSCKNIPRSTIAVLETHKDPPQGVFAWKDIGTKTGYVNLTSATSVRTSLALNYPFPMEWYSEDSHTWFRMFAGSRENCFDNSFPSFYRILSDTKFGSASRDLLKEKGIDHCEEKRRVETEGFEQAIEIALEKKLISPGEKPDLLVKFKKQLAKDIQNEELIDNANLLVT